MPIDVTLIPALERELAYAKQVRAGGQPSDPARVKAIEESLAAHKRAAGRNDKETVEVKPTEKSVKADTLETADAAAPKETA